MVEFDVPDPRIIGAPTLVTPDPPHPRHTLALSPLDDQPLLRFSIKYLYVYTKPEAELPSGDDLRASLSRTLSLYPTLAGRVRPCTTQLGDGGLEVDCNGEGALFTEASIDTSADEFLRWAAWPNRSWSKLLYRPVPPNGRWLVGVPPLAVQVTHLSCGGMILCTAINHCVMDGIASAHFLQTWAQLTAKKHTGANTLQILPVPPSHTRPPILMPKKNNNNNIAFEDSTDAPAAAHLPLFVSSNATDPHLRHIDLSSRLLSHPQNLMTPISATFTPSHTLQLKRALSPPTLKCTSFEALAAHVWRSWVRALVTDAQQYPPSLRVKLLFSVNVRDRVGAAIPASPPYSGNAFVLACAECPADRLVSSNLRAAVEIVQAAKAKVNEGYVQSVVEALGERRGRRPPDLSASLVISQWSKLGIEDVNFGAGLPVHVGPLASEIYCLFLPIVGDVHAFNVLLSVPNHVAGRLDKYLSDLSGAGVKYKVEGRPEAVVGPAAVGVVDA